MHPGSIYWRHFKIVAIIGKFRESTRLEETLKVLDVDMRTFLCGGHNCGVMVLIRRSC